MSDQQITVYEAVGGEPYFTALVKRFYAAVVDDDLLRPMYPRDLEGAEERLRLFLMQYWGGPSTYSDRRGHPRLRMRHNPYPVDIAARDAWLRAMVAAVEADPPEEPMRSAILEYFMRSADFMRNTPEADDAGTTAT